MKPPKPPKPPKPIEHYGPGYVKTVTIVCEDGTERVCAERDFRTTLEGCPNFRGFRVERVWGWAVELEDK